jgi:formylglycine-generating enzyme required for sulfatase activity
LLCLAAAACNPSEARPTEQSAPASAGPEVEASPAVQAPASATAKAAEEAAPAPPAGMVRVPAGVFLMGATYAVGNPEEKPAHEAIVASFHLDQTEVTMAAYGKCVAAGACKPAHVDQRFCNGKEQDHEDHPVNCVDLPMATAYCAWAGKRMPSEREWEYAASGGERRRFSWGEADPTPANSCYDHPGGTCPVKTFEPGAFQLYDMTGNVWEWTSSVFDPYPSRPQIDAIDPRKQYSYRGGSWSRRFPKWMRTLLRNRYLPHEYSAALGIRCAKSVEPLECPAQTEAQGGACVRTSGDVLCEPSHRWDGQICKPDVAGETAKVAGTWPPGTNAASTPPDPLGVPQEGPDAEEVAPAVTRSRTAQHDADCQRHWPKTPASYLFKGGKNYPSRKPILRAAGCVPRDMGWSWTSACCPG